MKLWKVAIALMVLPMISMVGTSWTFSLDFWANSSGNVTIPNQPLTQTFAVATVDLNLYYFVNNTVAVGKNSVDDIADIQPLVYYNNASGKDARFYLNSTGNEGLNSVCQVYIKPSSGLTQMLTPDIVQNFGQPANNTAYFIAIKYLQQNGRCKFNLVVLD